MLDSTISQENLSEMLDLMTTARTSSADEVLDLTVLHSAVRFVVTGRDSESTVQAESPGSAQLPVELLPKIQKTAESFPDDPIATASASLFTTRRFASNPPPSVTPKSP